ncbi:HEAT repeat domain-containing protein [Luteolibacter flavescens]|uniref:HEAT repeat domain-containing protein n=1 Tax=Luteolibacter flavescens TaxID=1859460 RepID=A0ABT3FQJ0_9BACT|nr:HEAT repeat domain-containing protein [Luteolibacter flavescens]MCW1885851.1 HEAT repeat domain-containing protein [Luteolibacter flavescens]
MTWRWLCFVLSCGQPVAAEPELDVSAASGSEVKLLEKKSAAETLRDAVAVAREDRDIDRFTKLVALGKEAGTVSEELVGLLDDPDPNVRLGACLTLGYMDRVDLWPQLTRCLKDQDWRVSFSACLGLSRWKAEGALDSLKELEKSHWYPRVRSAAEYAMMSIRNEKPNDGLVARVGPLIDDNLSSPRNFLFIYFVLGEDDSMADEAVEKLGFQQKKRPFWNAGSGGNGSVELLFPLEYQVLSKGAVAAGKAGWDDSCELSGHRKVGGDTLLGLCTGDWGGGLFVFSGEDKVERLLQENILGFFEWNGRWVALSGLNHLGIDVGMVYEVVGEPGAWQVRLMHALPGCPKQFGVMEDGRLFVNTYGGAVIIGKDGKFEFLGSGKAEPGK